MSEILNLQPEEIKRISQAIANILVEDIASKQDTQLLTSITVGATSEMVEVTEVIRLDLVASSTLGILDPIGQIGDFIKGLIDSAKNLIVSGIETFIETVVTPAINAVDTFLRNTIKPIIDDIWDAITSTISGIGEALTGLPKFIQDKIVTPLTDFFTKTIPDAISKVTDFFTKTLPDFFTDVTNFFSKTLPDLFSKVIDFFTKTLPSLFDTVVSFFTKTLPNLFDIVISFFTKTIPSLFDTVISFFTKTLPNLFNMVTTFFTKTLPSLFGSITTFFTETLPSLFGKITEFFTETIPNMVSKSIEAFNNFINMLLNAPTQIPNIIHAIGLNIWEKIMKPMFDYLLNNMIQPVIGAVSPIAVTFQGFTNAILRIPEWLRELPGWIFDYLAKINLPNWLYQHLIAPVLNIFRTIAVTIWDGVKNLWDWIWDSVTDFIGWGINQTKAYMEDISENLMMTIKSATDFLMKFTDKAMELMKETLEKATSLLVAPFNYPFKDKLAEVLEKEIKAYGQEGKLEVLLEKLPIALGKSSLYITSFFSSFIMSHYAISTLNVLGKSIEALFDRLIIDIEESTEPQGIGIKLREIWESRLGRLFYHTIGEFHKWIHELYRGIVYGFSIWLTRPLIRLINLEWRDIIPIEIPPLMILEEASRRALPHEEFTTIKEYTKWYMAMLGYPTKIIDLYFKTPSEYSIKVKDRFGKDRMVPLSLIYRLPSASDVARMMVRDLFHSIKDFQKIYLATGMSKDIGILYYLLRFRYPPPERLWQFTVRGISGLLWATLTDEEKAELEEMAKKLGAQVPLSPIALNKKYDTLLSAFKTYMKWHDYFRGSWFKKEVHGFNFTSDNLIYIDTLADIPTKIDQRWMVRWGLYETLAKAGVGRLDPVQSFIKIVTKGEPSDDIKSGIYMELANFCRTLQATGLHPYWVPMTAVAEAINALTDERTLLRTGFINLFKEGFWDVNALETLLGGIIKAYFGVQYFDIKDMDWVRGYVEHPVMFLPAERKLLELRALMDRSLDMLREIQRDISRGYQEWIIDSYEEYKAKLTEVINKVNEFFKADYEAITGQTLPDNRKLKFVDDYYRRYVEALGIWRDIYTVRRVRTWTQRWLGWIMYRVAYGAVKKEDVEKLISYVREKAKLTDYESTFISNIMNILYGIAQREYSPTPSQLATLSEYIVISKDIIKKVFEAREIPAEWQSIWLKYIDVRPIADDVRGLLTSYRRAMLYIEIPQDIKQKVESYASLIGFTQREWDILALRVQIEELIQQARESRREYIPTPYMLATLCEYLPEARQFYPKVAEAKRIPPEWQPLWAKYIDIRPLVDELKKYLSRAESLYARFAITEDEFKKVLEEVSSFLGYTNKELAFLKKITDYERYKTAWTEVIGDVDRMMSLAEYSPKARNFALGTIYKMIDALPIDPNTKNLLKEMWEQYIRVRPVYDEVRRYITDLINAYVEGIIDDAILINELNALKKWGLSDDEIMFYKALAGMRKARKLKIPLIYPT